MEAWENIATMREFEDYKIRKGPVPEYDEDSYNLAFSRCKENKCGTYDTNWGCNPGAKRDVAAFYETVEHAIIMSREFEADYHDKELLASITESMQRGVRKMILELRNNGIDCEGFLDGPCLYCGKCAYPDPCRFPEMKTPSVSTLGIDLKKYFEGIGETFSFQEGRITLYGFIFVKRRA